MATILATAIVPGIISSIIASLVFAFLTFGIKPKIDVASVICVTESEDNADECIYRFKIINKSRFQLMNISYTLDYCTDMDDGISHISTIPPGKSKLSTIAGMSKKNTDYTVRISYPINEKEYPMADNVRLIFTIQGVHPFSNTSICKSFTYVESDLKRDCIFQIGKELGHLRQSDKGSHLSKSNVTATV